MPVHSRASIRYARALLMAAEQRGALESLRDEVQGIRTLISEVPTLRAFLEDPTVAMEQKLAIMEQLFGGKVSSLVWQFLGMLTRKYRERMLPDILDATLALLDEREGRMVAEVASAVELSADQQAHLRQQLERLTGKQVKLEVRQDASLVSGFVAKVGDTVYDTSLAAQLGRLRRQFAQATLRTAEHER